MSDTRVIAGRIYTVHHLPPQRAWTRNRIGYKGGRRAIQRTGGNHHKPVRW